MSGKGFRTGAVAAALAAALSTAAFVTAAADAGHGPVTVTRSVLSAPATGEPTWSTTASPKPSPRKSSTPPRRQETSSSSAGDGAIRLTFDDGPDPRWTPQILQILTENHATATFFNIGQNAAAYPDLVRQIRAQGSQVANHTWDHPSLPSLGDAAIARQLDRTDAVQGRTPCVRPPYGATSARVRSLIAARGQRQELWDVDTRDWARPGAASIEAQLLAAKPGSTVLMHTGGGDRSQTVTALRDALPKLRAKGIALQGIPGC
ncbi:polysaccharide deacetylase family protein [Flexivirga meconopsidis]|uniref:polysaccharide deacetylase family protein n=1 Tax=Flexivirga meconopsidis TaxID=2977121 RepID=UPI00223F6E3F|nr:polysaccharide deacetylase family protein [Flexivirga meconopsidis]